MFRQQRDINQGNFAPTSVNQDPAARAAISQDNAVVRQRITRIILLALRIELHFEQGYSLTFPDVQQAEFRTRSRKELRQKCFILLGGRTKSHRLYRLRH
jgi:hypothetical protein